jgi:hypothetical protein
MDKEHKARPKPFRRGGVSKKKNKNKWRLVFAPALILNDY